MTAEEFLKGDEENEPWTGDIKGAMIEFAQFHVEAALKAASEKAEVEYPKWKEDGYDVKKSSILNAYSLSNIK